jgi:hypothetical protein
MGQSAYTTGTANTPRGKARTARSHRPIQLDES